jgi:hypothetical protein
VCEARNFWASKNIYWLILKNFKINVSIELTMVNLPTWFLIT